MKKISILLMIILVLFMNFSYAINSNKIIEAAQYSILDTVDIEIQGASQSDITLKFYTDEELLELSIAIRYTIEGEKTSEYVLFKGSTTGSKCQVINNGTPQEDGTYLYCFVLTSAAKISTFRLDITYSSLNHGELTEYLYVTNGNPNVGENTFSATNAIIIAFITSVFAVIGTFITIRASESNVQIADEEE